MALLLAMFQKMRITREYNECVRKEVKLASKQKRIKDNIAKTQERYTSLIEQITRQAEMMKSQAKVMFNQQIGMDMMNSNPWSGMSVFVQQQLGAMLEKGQEKQTVNGKEIPEIKFADGGESIMNAIINGTLQADVDENNKPTGTYNDNAFSKEEVNFAQSAMRYAQQMQQQAQMWAQQQSSNFDQNVSIWAEARKAELEAEQDAAIEPLNYEDTMMDLEHEEIKVRIETLKEEKENYKQLLQEEVKDSAPKFGLG